MSNRKSGRTNPEQAAREAQNPAQDPARDADGGAASFSEEAGAPDFPDSAEAAGDDAIARLEAEAAELKDRLMRALAECENVRRRAERDRQEAAEFGGTRLARDLLAVYDNLERALGHADEAAREHAGSLIEGVELTRRELLNAFGKHRIEKFAPEPGEKFDPHFQQAMFEAPIPGARPGTVIEVIQPGFTIAGRLLRPALVGVAKAQPAAEPAEGEAGGQSGSGDPSTDRRA